MGFGAANPPEPAPELLEAAQKANSTPTLTYEDLVVHTRLDNGVRMTMSDSPNGESAFYAIHFEIENELSIALTELQGAEKDTRKIIAAILRSRDIFRDYLESPIALEFTNFRHLFFGHQDYPGPSGAQSAQIPCIDLLSSNPIYTHHELAKLNRNARKGIYANYFANAASLLIELTTRQPVEQNVNSAAIHKALNSFRGVHYRAIRQLIPEMTIGTAGEEIVPFLKSKLSKGDKK